MRLAIVVAIIGYATANICNDGTGTWSYSISDGVTDFAYGGVALNNKYNCFEGCVNTGTAVQDFKVALNGSRPAIPTTTMSSMESASTAKLHVRKSSSKAIRVAEMKRIQADGEDPNAISCVDPVLRADIANAVSKVTSYSCKGIVKAVLFNLNRPGWAVNCVDFTAFNMSGFYQDYNFCDYDAFVGGQLYTIRMALIDTTSS
ncbi:hypothetical protein Q1695_004600 [Nippostrongylus brasiliensis]|nr:hypothetical protein Q1695_004600 [Nippostrongylus brasiliensis]